jgi:glutaminyl-peptide cyclotransferase
MRKIEISIASFAFLRTVACNTPPSNVSSPTVNAAAPTQSANPSAALPPSATGGFDGAQAFEHVRKLVEIGPRPPGSQGIHRAQAYIISQLKSFGCPVEEHDSRGSTPLGDIAMKNISAKIPGTGSGIVLYTTHYDTVRLPNFVGADDGGTGTMLELARIFCSRKTKRTLNTWIVFFDGEEAQGEWTDRNSIQWSDTDSNFGSREMAASMALSAELKRVKAMLLADINGPSDLKIKRDKNSTPWLTDLIWATARQLGYTNVFVNESTIVSGDDHLSFIRRGVPACDLIDDEVESTYWHTPQDTLEKVDPRSLAIVGHVFIETLPALERKFH